jgi:hypothetical protein
MHSQTYRTGLPPTSLSQHDAAATCKKKKNYGGCVTRLIRLNHVNLCTAYRPHFIYDRSVVPNLFHLRTPWQPISINCTLYISKRFVINLLAVNSNLYVVTVNSPIMGIKSNGIRRWTVRVYIYIYIYIYIYTYTHTHSKLKRRMCIFRHYSIFFAYPQMSWFVPLEVRVVQVGNHCNRGILTIRLGYCFQTATPPSFCTHRDPNLQ